MTIRLRTAFFIGLGLITLWFLYSERQILAPFVLAAIFAYIFNPIVTFLSSKIKLPRTISIILIWTIIIGSLSFLGVIVIRRVIEESAGLKQYVQEWTMLAKNQVVLLPEFLRPTFNESITSLQKLVLTTSISLFAIFPQAISGIIDFFLFLVSTFYFLKEGSNIFDKFLNLTPKDYRIETEILLRRINMVLGEYLRGQLLVILSSFLMFFVFYTILGLDFAFILALIAGFLEVVVLIGPMISGVLAVVIVLLTGVSNFNLDPFQAAAVLIVGSFIIRQIQDYVVTPHIMGKVVKVHPLVILFAVMAGGNIAGILGLVLAVPVAAVIRILLIFFLDKINERSA